MDPQQAVEVPNSGSLIANINWQLASTLDYIIIDQCSAMMRKLFESIRTGILENVSSRKSER